MIFSLNEPGSIERLADRTLEQFPNMFYGVGNVSNALHAKKFKNYIVVGILTLPTIVGPFVFFRAAYREKAAWRQDNYERRQHIIEAATIARDKFGWTRLGEMNIKNAFTEAADIYNESTRPAFITRGARDFIYALIIDKQEAKARELIQRSTDYFYEYFGENAENIYHGTPNHMLYMIAGNNFFNDYVTSYTLNVYEPFVNQLAPAYLEACRMENGATPPPSYGAVTTSLPTYEEATS